MFHPFFPLRPPQPDDSHLQTPPESPRKRRRELRESDETDGEFSIETYIYRSDPYRSTSIDDPLPYPILAEDAPQDVAEQVLQHRERIWGILVQHGFPTDVGGLGVHRISKPGYPGGEVLITVLRIVYEGAALPRVLGDAKSAIYRFLIDNGVHGVEVEIVDWKNCFRPSLFPISQHDLTVPVYEASKQSILGILQDQIPSLWQSACLYRVGVNEEKAVPTIVITVSPRGTADWSALRNRVLRSFGSGYITIGLEFLPGSVDMLVDERGVNSIIRHMDCDGELKMGYSIGIPGEDGGGTLGGFFTLSHDGSTHHGFLTNYHVVRPPTSANESVKEKYDRVGTFFSENSEFSEVICFSPRDCRAVSRHLSKYHEELQASWNNFKDEIAIRQEAGARVSTGLQMRHDCAREDIEICGKKQDIVSKMPRTLGKVLISSGKGTSRGRIVDWAFISLDQSDFQRNIMPDTRHFNGPFEGDSHPRFQIKSGYPLTDFGDLVKNEPVFKVGRTTDLTGGICNGVKQLCHWKAADRRRYENGEEVQLGDITEEFVIVGQRKSAGRMEQEIFAENGDSGSILVDASGSVCGLLYAGTAIHAGSLYQGSVGLAMTMSDVRASIKAKGCELGLEQ